jgi:hypothetical protein
MAELSSMIRTVSIMSRANSLRDCFGAYHLESNERAFSGRITRAVWLPRRVRFDTPRVVVLVTITSGRMCVPYSAAPSGEARLLVRRFGTRSGLSYGQDR